MSSAHVRIRNRLAVAAAILIATLAGCTQIVLVSPYDETTDAGIMALEKSVSGLLDQLDQDPVPAYGSLEPRYDAIREDLGSLYLRNQARPKNEQTVKQLQELRAELDILEGQHRDGRLSQVMIDPARDILETAFRAILTLELAKKELGRS